MRRQNLDRMRKTKMKIGNHLGMTMAELLAVIAILGALAGVAFVGFWNYQRSLGQMERDSIAKEIFVAAQNHLTAAQGEGYLGTTDFGELEDADQDIWYYVVNGEIKEDSVMGQMLPFGSIDETVRAGGSYIVRYQKKTGIVLDVFYCSRRGNGYPEQYNYAFQYGDYASVKGLGEGGNKADRRDWNSHILGWYGGTKPVELATLTVASPVIKVENAEMLYVTVKDKNDEADNEDIMLQLIIRGISSGAKKAVNLKEGADVRVNRFRDEYFVILDDITSNALHFANIEGDTEEKFIPGEDIRIQAVAFSNTKLANIAYSSKSTTNSLFGSINSAGDKAYIGNIRHLENLDKSVSKLDDNDGSEGDDKIKIANAEQTGDFSWVNFQKEIKKIESKASTGTASEDGYQEVGISCLSGPGSGTGCFLPIEPDYVLAYDGKGRSISDVSVSAADDAGLFGAVSTVESIKNLELIDFGISGTNSAGALAGTLNGCTVSNVLVRNSGGAFAEKISAPTAGGLIGKTAGGTKVLYSGAAVIVNGSTYAGGLVGDAGGEVAGCYTGGHTKSGSYEEWVRADDNSYDVTGGTAGGLVGVSSAEIRDSYSTCSVSGTTAGGFAGSAGGTVRNCYAAGLVDKDSVQAEGDRTTNGSKGAFAGVLTGSATDCGYYSIINEVERDVTEDGETTSLPDHYLGAVGDRESTEGITALDLDAASYNDFVGDFDDWNNAKAYDRTLARYYNGRYTLRTVDELESTVPDGYAGWDELFVVTHVGDWPAPEIFVVNKAG